jgi:hypothetical protein
MNSVTRRDRAQGLVKEDDFVIVLCSTGRISIMRNRMMLISVWRVAGSVGVTMGYSN